MGKKIAILAIIISLLGAAVSDGKGERSGALFALIFWFAAGYLIYKYFQNRKGKNAIEVAPIITAEEAKPVIGQTKYSRRLWAALKERGIESITEYPDGAKTIDIAILPARLYIEVDGIQHTTNLEQVMRDLKRDDYSDRDGFRTIHVSNFAIEQGINEIADEISRQARERQQYFSPNK